MTRSSLTRRGALALGAVALAGCTGSGDGNGASTPTETDASGNAEEPDDGDGNGRDVPERDVEPNWDAAADFRTWLIDSDVAPGGNRRFDYTETFPDDVDLETVLPTFDELTIEDVDGHLIQTYTQVFFGSFDADALAATAEDAADAEVVDEYGGYTVVAETLPTGEDRTLAVGDDAIVVGPDYEARIDAHRGTGERLEEVDPEFTHLFRHLPHDTTVTGEYGPPADGTVNLESIYLWGVSSETPSSDELTWVFVLEREADLTEETLSELEAISSDVLESSMNGRTATVVGAPPEMPDELTGAAGED
ncbi:hypothetical protein [Halopiger goleimassiliensis]|uniref:hypothetical protein n=1 Tax=Halopiger goleimassiliensis TaxID=1293048 RepID=UPI000677CF4B|nr:hypothetical protein [Halopiger goleimassiliensis]